MVNNMQPDKLKTALNYAADLVKDHWTSGSFARDKYDLPVDLDSDKACSWCMLGAIFRTETDLKIDGREFLDFIYSNLPNGLVSITHFNDKIAQDGEQVSNVFRKMAEMLTDDPQMPM